jgi:thiol-disulfide isomerase/thioredoxin
MKRLSTLFLSLLIALYAGSMMAGELKPYKGKPMPDFSLEDMNGKKHSLADYKGKVVLINFWATWCPPCVKEMPSMQRLQDKFADQPFETLAVNMGEDKATINDFLESPMMKATPLSFAILLDADGDVLKSWKIFAFPTTFLIDKEGNITHGLFGGLEWDSPEAVAVVEELLAK